MPDLVQQNLDFFKEFIPGVFNQLIRVNSGNSYQISPAKTEGLSYLLCQQEQREVLLHSKYNPVQEAETWAASQDLTDKRHAVLFGLGLGYQLETLQRNYPNLNFYIYEPDLAIFSKTLEHKDWSKLDWAQIKHIIFEDGSGKFNQFIASILNFMKDDWVFLALPAFERCFAPGFAAFKESLKESKEEYLQRLNTNSFFQQEWTVNSFNNLPYILSNNSIFHYKEFFKDKTVIMTASGPSLMKAIPFLKEIKEKHSIPIIAAGSSVNGLLKQGLIPDMFTSYDPIEGNYTALKPSLDKGIPFVFGSTINNAVTKNHIGPKAYFITSQDTVINNLIGGINSTEVIFDAPSITAITFQLLNKLGVRKVILAGQDLAFYEDLHYAEGISAYFKDDNLATEDEKAGYIEILANNGEKVFTSKSFNLMKNSIELIIKHCSFAEVINTSEHGAQIAGTSFKDWTEVMAELPDYFGTEEICFNQQPPKVSFKKIKKRMTSILKDFEEKLAKIDQATKKFLRAYEKGDDVKTNAIYENISTYLSKLTSSNEFISFIHPMVRNEDHLIRKIAIDISKMTMEQRRDFLNKEIAVYLQGVQLSIAKLKDTVKQWDSLDRREA